MIKTLSSQLVLGLLLILGGLAFLLESLNVIYLGGNIWGILFILGGLYLFSLCLMNRDHWGTIIPGTILIGIGIVIMLAAWLPHTLDYLNGAIILGSIALAFWLVYINNRSYWWAIIPAGVMTTFTAIVALEPYGRGADMGGVFFVGLGFTFALVRLLTGPANTQKWAFIPAAILSIMGLIMLSFSTSPLAYVWPVLLILIGGYLVYTTLTKSRENNITG